MNKINYVKDCSLTRHLKEVSILNSSPKAQFAGALLCGFGYPSFTHSPDTKIMEHLAQGIAKTTETKLFIRGNRKVSILPHSDSCEVGALFKDR